jgi:hypothetical protein
MWDNSRAFRNQVDHSNPRTTRSSKVKRTCEVFCWFSSDDLRAKIELASCRPPKPGDFMAVTPLNWDEIIEEDDDEANWEDTGAPSSGRSVPGDGNDNDGG